MHKINFYFLSKKLDIHFEKSPKDVSTVNTLRIVSRTGRNIR